MLGCLLLGGLIHDALALSAPCALPPSHALLISCPPSLCPARMSTLLMRQTGRSRCEVPLWKGCAAFDDDDEGNIHTRNTPCIACRSLAAQMPPWQACVRHPLQLNPPLLSAKQVVHAINTTLSTAAELDAFVEHLAVRGGSEQLLFSMYHMSSLGALDLRTGRVVVRSNKKGGLATEWGLSRALAGFWGSPRSPCAHHVARPCSQPCSPRCLPHADAGSAVLD